MSASGGTRAIIWRRSAANLGIAVAKFVGFLITGSSSMLAESTHSVADSANQGLLLVGGRRARRAATEEHPFGYGRDRYFYAFVVALVLFSLGSLFSLYEGWHKLTDHEPLTQPIVAVVILVVAIGLESFSLRTAVVESNKVRGDANWVQFVRRAKAPELPVVLLEDCGALLGLFFALVGVSLAWATGDPVWDAYGTLAIGVLLGVIAIILIVETKSLLIGEGASPQTLDRITAALVGPGVDRVDPPAHPVPGPGRAAGRREDRDPADDDDGPGGDRDRRRRAPGAAGGAGGAADLPGAGPGPRRPAAGRRRSGRSGVCRARSVNSVHSDGPASSAETARLRHRWR